MVGTSEEPRSRRRDRLALILASLGAVTLVGCGENAESELDQLRRSAPPDTYYLGDSFEGEELSHAEPGFFVYGTCDPGPDSGCAPPIQIQHFEFEPRMWRIAVGCTLAASIRGVPAVHHDSVILLTRGRFVKIYATSRKQTLRAFQALRSIDGAVQPGDALPRAPARVIRAVQRACRPR